MEREVKELALRLSGASDLAAAAERALKPIDADVAIRIDLATGIVHVTTCCETIEVEDALTAAGLEVTAATG